MEYHLHNPRIFNEPEGVTGTQFLGSGGGAWFTNVTFPKGLDGRGGKKFIYKTGGESWRADDTKLFLTKEDFTLEYTYKLALSDNALVTVAWTDDGERASTWAWTRKR